MISFVANRHVRKFAAVLSLGVAVLFASGCNKLKARDNLNEGVNAFKAGNYTAAADHFKTAIDLDADLPGARLYLATAYMQQFVPGTDTPENKQFQESAMREFNEVLKSDPKNSLATASIANLYYQTKDFANAQIWYKKVVDNDPKNKEGYYTLGVIAWTEFVAPDREARIAGNMKAEDPGPLKDVKKRAELKERFWASLTAGIEQEKKALEIDPEYENAMSYMNLLVRYRADLQDTKEAYDADRKEADAWVDKALQTTKIKAERKAANPNGKAN